MNAADRPSPAVPPTPPPAGSRWRAPRPPWSRLLTSPIRCRPDFLVVGAQKAGTTSLFASLNDHPSIWMPPCKECHFFSGPWRPAGFYRGFFPTGRTRRRMERERGGPVQLGEATPYYLFHPRAPQRVARALPAARLIVILRDPVERAWSHYRHCVRRGTESLTFEAALDAEPSRIAAEEARLARSPLASSDAHRHHSYVARGRYAEQLLRWFALVDRDRVHVELFEHLRDTPGPTLARIEGFLGLTVRDAPSLPRRNAGSASEPMAEATRRRLAATFAEPNRELAALLGIELPWATD